MPRLSSRIAAVALFLFTVVAIPQVRCLGDELPTLDQLIEATPNIDTSDPETKSFRFTVAMDMPIHSIETTVTWRRDEFTGMRMLVGKDRIPGWLISGQSTQMFDACNGRLFMLPPAHPKFHLRQSGRNLAINYGLVDFGIDENKKKDLEPIVLDLKSMIRELRERAEVSLNGDGTILVTIPPSEIDESKEDQGGLVAFYEPRAPYKLIRLELQPGNGEPPLLQVSDVSFNENANLVWPVPPADETLLKGVMIVDRTDREDKSILKGIDQAMVLARVFLIHMALEDPETRKNAMFLGVDWEKTRKFALESGPEVERLWR